MTTAREAPAWACGGVHGSERREGRARDGRRGPRRKDIGATSPGGAALSRRNVAPGPRPRRTPQEGDIQCYIIRMDELELGVSTDRVVELLEGRVGPLSGLLHDAMAGAIEGAEQRLVGLEHAVYPHLRPQVVRAELRSRLVDQPLPAGWKVGGNSRQMGQLYLEASGEARLRFLKGGKINPGGVPHAGYNSSRRATWHQAPLVGLESTGPLTFLLVWNYLDAEARTEGYSLRLAHPLHPGRVGANVPCDLLMDLPRQTSIFEGIKAFDTEEEVDLFNVTIDAYEWKDSLG